MMETPNTFWDLFFGYSVLWGLIVLFMLRVQSEQRRMAARLSELESRTGSGQ